jgi:hypothetical protein
MEKKQSTCMALVGNCRRSENLLENEGRTISKESLRLKGQSFLLPVPAHDAKIRKSRV